MGAKGQQISGHEHTDVVALHMRPVVDGADLRRLKAILET
jgi:hypothetical protein